MRKLGVGPKVERKLKVPDAAINKEMLNAKGLKQMGEIRENKHPASKQC